MPSWETRRSSLRTVRKGASGKGFRTLLLFGEGLIDDAQRGRVYARIGDRIEPMPQLGVEIIEIAKGAAEEEVLADVTERPLHFAFCFRPVRPASARLEAIMPGEIDKRAIIDDQAVRVLA